MIQRNDGFPPPSDAMLSLLPAAANSERERERAVRWKSARFPGLMRDHARNYMVIPGGNVHQLSWALA